MNANQSDKDGLYGACSALDQAREALIRARNRLQAVADNETDPDPDGVVSVDSLDHVSELNEMIRCLRSISNRVCLTAQGLA